MREIVQSYLAGNVDEAARIHRRLLPLMTVLMTAAGNPSGVKHALNGAGFSAGKPRLPLVEPDEAAGEADHGGGAAAADRPGGRGLAASATSERCAPLIPSIPQDERRKAHLPSLRRSRMEYRNVGQLRAAGVCRRAGLQQLRDADR